MVNESRVTRFEQEKCIVYLDDILVIGQYFKQHMHNLREVLEHLRVAGL